MKRDKAQNIVATPVVMFVLCAVSLSIVSYYESWLMAVVLLAIVLFSDKAIAVADGVIAKVKRG